MTHVRPVVSFVVPLFNTGDSLSALLSSFRALRLTEAWELVLVDDGSADGTAERASITLHEIGAPVKLVELARNYGEHAAVMEGPRHAEGEFVITLDDDLQNPLEEAVRLVRQLQLSNAEVVYARYTRKQHSWLRNAGSSTINSLATLLIGKPHDLYLASFRAIRRALVQRIVTYQGPYPYIDGLILGATNRIEQLEVTHASSARGRSGYTLRKLVRLAMIVCFDSSIMPLRLASVLGMLLCVVGVAGLVGVLMETWLVGRQQVGWASLMGVLTIFSGAQLMMLGLIGEYVGRAFLTASNKPQSLVRTVTVHHPPLE